MVRIMAVMRTVRIVEFDQHRPRQPSVGERQQHGAERARRRGLGRRGDARHHGAEDGNDDDDGRHQDLGRQRELGAERPARRVPAECAARTPG